MLVTASMPLNWEDELPFGKYRGYTVGAVAEIREGCEWLLWACNNTRLRLATEVVRHIESETQE